MSQFYELTEREYVRQMSLASSKTLQNTRHYAYTLQNSKENGNVRRRKTKGRKHIFSNAQCLQTASEINPPKGL